MNQGKIYEAMVIKILWHEQNKWNITERLRESLKH